MQSHCTITAIYRWYCKFACVECSIFFLCTDPFIDMYDNCKLINLNIVGLTKTSSNIILINVSKTGCTISGVELANFNTGFDLIRSTASYNLSGLVLNNVNAKSAFVSVGDSSFSKLDFTHNKTLAYFYYSIM